MEGGEEVITLHITSNVTSFQSEKRFKASLTVGELKGKLELITGAQAALMNLTAYDQNDQPVVKLEDNTATLASLNLRDGMRIHAEDPTVKGQEFEDLQKVEKYTINEEKYAQRAESMRAFKMQNKLGNFSDKSPASSEQPSQDIQVGCRCEVHVPGQPSRRGTVMYIGKTDFKPGMWVGIEYDEPLGKNDGSVNGKKYFICKPKYGGFVKPQNIKVGDYPPLVPNENDEI